MEVHGYHVVAVVQPVSMAGRDFMLYEGVLTSQLSEACSQQAVRISVPDYDPSYPT